MLGQSVINGRSSSPSNNRVFVYEVTGLKQNEQTDSNGYPVRNSSSTFVSVPYNRMNETMQKITRMGGTIVNIKPLGASSPQKDEG
ncbi:phycobilisome linker polypeptide [Lusitaniella coriacea LEGE 07157]|uniref:Phycobilisome linker polypeptide n=1 Tax=Lusitaniella coriacea LEGE 07157 TaxID=945747 RepID=A0A8J7DVN0_9CYAN|nr:phycobilisome linker polypeptide [Lusitaniella coriacea]MBE9115929.1 phycobilisome linker polypeptide [Lusitaniella coriacea LEGE 07157]